MHLVMNYRLPYTASYLKLSPEKKKKRSKCVLFISIVAMFIFFLSLIEVCTIEAYVNVTILL